MMYKKSFVLLEVIIALSLVLSAVTLLIQNPLRFFLAEMRTLQDMELQRIADESFYAIKEHLYSNTIAWEDLHAENLTKAPRRTLSDATISIKHLSPLRVERSYQLVQKSHDRLGTDGQTYRLIYIYLFLSPQNALFRQEKLKPSKTYSYRVIACKKTA
ncbi:MAG: hypothetical protein JW769_03610 [Parachlamydiales bacterium]|nr:hypothetical protein [Parachlamydiales bacterium]